MSTTPIVNTKLLDNGKTEVSCGSIIIEANPSELEKTIKMVTNIAIANTKLDKAYDKNDPNNIKAEGYGFGLFDHPMKLYGVFIENQNNNAIVKKVGEFYNAEAAQEMMDDIKNNPGKYVDKDGNYIAKIKIIFEAGRIIGDMVPLVTGASNFDKRFQFII